MRGLPSTVLSVVLSIVLVAATATACSSSGPSGGSHAPSVSSWLRQRPLYVAHRGGDADWPGGTLRAYAGSTAWNSSLALEIPARRTADGVWVVSDPATTGQQYGVDDTIATTTWSTLSRLRTRSGDQPMARVVDVLDRYRDRVIFIDDKSGNDVRAFFALLAAHGGHTRFVVKCFWADAAVAARAHALHYVTWGYYFVDDLGHLAATYREFDLLGLPWNAPRTAFAQARATGEPVIAHIVATAAQAATARAAGASGYMVSGVTQVVPRSD